jgi:23S rRNA (guanosine2251-2'-O)-methyltransferase
VRDDPERPAELGERELGSYPFDDDALVVVLDGITDPQNFGAAARSAEAAGGSMLVTRVRRAADVSPAAIRASAGALLHLPHARVANIPRALDRLQGVGFTVVGLDGDASTTIFDDPCPDGRVALVVGSEGEGMSRLVRERCDVLVSLPMRGRVGSLNASASLAAALYGYVLPSRRT